MGLRKLFGEMMSVLYSLVIRCDHGSVTNNSIEVQVVENNGRGEFSKFVESEGSDIKIHRYVKRNLGINTVGLDCRICGISLRVKEKRFLSILQKLKENQLTQVSFPAFVKVASK